MTLREREEQYAKLEAAARKVDGPNGKDVPPGSYSQLQQLTRSLGERDLFYLLTRILDRDDARIQWVLDRCDEYQADPDGYLDLWAREHYKSSIITFAGIIFGLINDPERTYGIFSFTRPIAKSFLRQIKQEMESNEKLKALWPEIFWKNPQKDSPKWSENDGIQVIRKGNPKEASVEAWGLVDGQPAGPHFTDLHYEDIVNGDAVRTPGMLQKVEEAFQNSLNLGTREGRRRAVGTPWHYADAYHTIIERKIMKVRKYPGTVDGTLEGKPVLLTREQLVKKYEDMGPYIFGCQILLNPIAENLQGFREEWLRFWKADRTTGLNLYLLCDPASEKKKESDYTTFILVGLGSDRNYYIVNWIRDRLSLTQKANVLFKWHQMYHPIVVGYEQYGMQADIAHFEDRMERSNYRFSIVPLGGTLKKFDRIGRLVPLFASGRVYLPEMAPYTQYDKTTIDVTKAFINDEYLSHPYEAHDDLLDALSRILDDDLGAVFPQGEEIDPLRLRRAPDAEYDPLRWGLRGE